MKGNRSASIEAWTSLSSLWAAAKRAARGKRHRASVARVLFALEPVVLRLRRSLRDGSWRPGLAHNHVIRDPKTRTITAAPFEDRIVHQALCAEIGPLLERHLIARTYACRTGLGTHAALRQARLWARSYPYAVHLDVRKYFPSIDHAIVLTQIDRALRCPATLAVCQHILAAGARLIEPARFHFPGDDLFTPFCREVGLPIGHLTSQHFANRYLSPVDHYATDRLRIHAYLRYMDDLLLFGRDREQTRDWAAAIEEACHKQRLRLHPYQVVPTSGGIGFLGFRILPHELRVKRSTVKRAIVRLQRLAGDAERDPSLRPRLSASLRATLAHWKHGDTFRLRTKVLRELGFLAGDFTQDDDD